MPSPYMTPTTDLGTGSAWCSWFLMRDDRPPYVVAISTGVQAVLGCSSVLCARAVVDDFGSLVVVQEWM